MIFVHLLMVFQLPTSLNHLFEVWLLYQKNKLSSTFVSIRIHYFKRIYDMDLWFYIFGWWTCKFSRFNIKYQAMKTSSILIEINFLLDFNVDFNCDLILWASTCLVIPILKYQFLLTQTPFFFKHAQVYRICITIFFFCIPLVFNQAPEIS